MFPRTWGLPKIYLYESPTIGKGFAPQRQSKPWCLSRCKPPSCTRAWQEIWGTGRSLHSQKIVTATKGVATKSLTQGPQQSVAAPPERTTKPKSQPHSCSISPGRYGSIQGRPQPHPSWGWEMMENQRVTTPLSLVLSRPSIPRVHLSPC